MANRRGLGVVAIEGILGFGDEGGEDRAGKLVNGLIKLGGGGAVFRSFRFLHGRHPCGEFGHGCQAVYALDELRRQRRAG